MSAPARRQPRPRPSVSSTHSVRARPHCALQGEAGAGAGQAQGWSSGLGGHRRFDRCCLEVRRDAGRCSGRCSKQWDAATLDYSPHALACPPRLRWAAIAAVAAVQDAGLAEAASLQLLRPAGAGAEQDVREA